MVVRFLFLAFGILMRYIVFHMLYNVCEVNLSREVLMAKTAQLSMRIDPELKSETEDLFAQFGLSLSEAITIFLNKSLMVGGIPFDLRQPRLTKETREAIAEAEAIKEGKIQAKVYETPKAMLDDVLGPETE